MISKGGTDFSKSTIMEKNTEPDLARDKVKDGQLGEGGFFPIFLSNLRTETVCDFDLYLQTDPKHQPVLYREKSLVFTETVKERLKENLVSRLLVPSNQTKAYYRYIEVNLTSILQDTQVAVEEKSELLYVSSMNMVKDVLADPRSGEVLPRTKSMVENSVAFLFHQENALQNLMRVSSYDYYTYTHSVNVGVFSIMLAKHLFKGSDAHNMHELGAGFFLHDIGKVRIAPDIINKPGKLTDEEMTIVRSHPYQGYKILKETNQLTEECMIIVMQHHEREDGSGYPRRLKRHEIHPYGRICCIADVYDALTAERSYKQKLTTFEALKLMKEQLLNHFQQEMFEKFVLLFTQQNGSVR